MGDVARPDLILPDSDETIEGRVRILHATLFETPMSLPNTVEIHPARHGTSACGGII